MTAAEQQEQLEVVVRRFAAVAPPAWVRLAGTWTVSVVPSGAVMLHGSTTAVVHGGDRWSYGRVAFDDALHDAVVRLRALAGDAWTRLDLRVESDGAFHVDLGHEPPPHPRGEEDDPVGPPDADLLDAWVAEHGTVPAGPPPARAVAHEVPRHTRLPVGLSADQVDTFARVAQGWAAEAPHGWVRIVGHEESAVTDASSGIWSVHVVVTRTRDGLEQDHFRTPRDLHFVHGDLVRDVTAASRTRAAAVEIVVDRDGHTVTVSEAEPDSEEDTTGPVRAYLDGHRAELEALAARIPPDAPEAAPTNGTASWWSRWRRGR